MENTSSFILKSSLIILLFFSFSFSSKGQIPLGKKELVLYGDLVITPIMAYTINEKRSNIPTHFLIANGIKGNIGFELGFLYSVFSPEENATAFLTTGISFHLLGIDYGQGVINLGEQQVSNHRHTRVFLGMKFIPLKKSKFFAISATAGYGNILANYSSKNINGRIRARTGDVSISFSFGLNQFVFQ